jgi:Nucleotidyltransferase domain
MAGRTRAIHIVAFRSAKVRLLVRSHAWTINRSASRPDIRQSPRRRLTTSIANAESQPAGKLPLDKIAETCRKYDVIELSIFGSVLRDDFGPESDIDFMAVIRNDDYGP